MDDEDRIVLEAPTLVPHKAERGICNDAGTKRAS